MCLHGQDDEIEYGHDGEGLFTGPVLTLLAAMILVLCIIAYVLAPA